MARKRLGELLIEAGAITPEQLQRALKEQKEWGGPLGQVLLDLNYLNEEGLVRALSTQLNIPIANLEGHRIPPMVLEMIPAEFCRDNALLPFNYVGVGAFLDVAMVEPVDLDTLDKIRVLTQCNIRPHFTTYGALARGLYRYHGFRSNFQSHRSRHRSSAQIDAAQRANVVLDAREREMPEEEPQVPETLTLRPVSQDDIDALVSKQSEPKQSGPEPAGAKPAQKEQAETIAETTRLESLLKANYQRLMEAEQRVADLESFLHRDERILRRILGLLVDRKVISSEELKRILDF